MANPVSTSTKLCTGGFSRLRQLVPNIVPVSKSTFWRMVARGDFPPPVRLSKRVTAWRNADVASWQESQQ